MSELKHYGIIGMKWGVRRYQNPDGTLTEAGKKRYSGSNVHEDHSRAFDKKKASEMSDAELRTRLNRIQMEQQYSKINGSSVEKGHSAVKKALAIIGTLNAIFAAGTTMKNNIEAIRDFLETYAGQALLDIVIDKV